MTVYIEQVIFDNMVMTGLICLLTCKVVKVKARISILIVSAIGTAVSVSYPFWTFLPAINIGFKFGLGIVLGTILMFGKKRKRLGVVVFFGITFLFGGVMFGLNYLIYGSVEMALKMPVASIGVGVYCIVGVVLYFVCCKLFAKLSKVFAKARFENMAVVDVYGKSIRLNGFVDSGNKAVYKGQHMALIGKDKLQKRISMQVGKDCDFVDISTVSGQSKIPVVMMSKIELYNGTSKNILYNIPLGLTDNDFVGFDILLPLYDECA